MELGRVWNLLARDGVQLSASSVAYDHFFSSRAAVLAHYLEGRPALAAATAGVS